VSSGEPEYDVVAIMNGIRAENRQRLGRGLLSDDDVDERARERFRAWARDAAIDPRLLDRFLDPGHDWNISTRYIIRTHRPGVLPRLGVLAKRIIRPVVRLYTDHILDRQTQINQYFCHLLHDAIRQIVRLEAKVAALEAERDEGRERADPLR
jgi:hypothetical protein